MRVVKLVGVIAGALLIAFVAPVLLGTIGRSSIGLFSLIVLGLIIAALTWVRRMDATASKVWFLRTHERGTTELQDRSCRTSTTSTIIRLDYGSFTMRNNHY